MKPSSLLRTFRLLGAYLLRPHGPRRGVRETRSAHVSGDFPTIVYEPESGRPRKTIVLVHGVSGRASEDPSLVHLARALGSLGFRCVTPALPGLANFRHDLKDVEALAEGIAYARTLSNAKVPVLAFSYGASFALCAAAHPKAREHCAAVLGFGAYYELDAALAHQLKLLLANPDPARDDADLADLRYTLLACHRDELELPANAWQHIDPTLRTFTTREPIEVKRAPLLEFARDVDYPELMRRYRARPLPAELSPKAVLSDVLCPVGLLHDPADRFVPANQAEQIRAHLDRRVGVPKTRVLTTPMLSHVQVDPRKSFGDLPRLVDLLDLALD
ncbi:MAG: alpha/beta hydrolase [Polyangiaceae bacterium]